MRDLRAAVAFLFVAIPVACTTGPGSIPASVEDLSADFEGAVFVTVSWKTPVDESGNGPTAYNVRYSLEPISETTWNDAVSIPENPIPQNPGDIQYLTIFGLEPLVEYSIGVKSAGDKGSFSDMSNVVQVHTSAALGDYFPLDQ